MQIVLQLALLGGVAYLAIFKSYFKEKGKNIATLEDLNQITHIVEKIRAQLAFSLQAQLSFRSEEHSAIVDYYSKYRLWLAALMDLELSGVTYQRIGDLERIRANQKSLYHEMSMAFGRMELFLHNEDIIKQQSKLTTETLKLEGRYYGATFEIAQCLIKAEAKKGGKDSNQMLEVERECIEDKSEILKKLSEDLIQFYADLLPLIEEHRATISGHLRSLLKAEAEEKNA